MASFHDAVLGDDLLPLVLSHARREQALRWAAVSTGWRATLVESGVLATLELRGGRLDDALSAALAPRLAREHLARLSVVEKPTCVAELMDTPTPAALGMIARIPPRSVASLAALQLDCERFRGFTAPLQAELPNLIALDLRGCVELPVPSVTDVVRRAPNLRLLDLRTCGKLHVPGVPAAAQPQVVMIHGLLGENGAGAPAAAAPIDQFIADVDDLLAAAGACRALAQLCLGMPEGPTPQGATWAARSAGVWALLRGAGGAAALRRLHLGGCLQVRLRDALRGAAGATAPLLPSLEVVDLTECTHVNDECVALLARAAPRLRELSLRVCCVGDGALVALAAHAARLERLNVSCTKVGVDGLRSLLDARHAQLRTLDLCYADHLARRDGARVAALLCERASPGLEMLGLGGFERLSDEELLALCDAHPKLRHVGIGGCRALSEAGVGDALARLARLEQLNAHRMRGIVTPALLARLRGACPMLRGLEISECELRDDEAVPGEGWRDEARAERFNQELRDWACDMEYDSSGGDGWVWRGAMDCGVD